MTEQNDINRLVTRLHHSLTAIETMLRAERQDEERQRSHYLDALRRKAAGQFDGNVTAEFFGAGSVGAR